MPEKLIALDELDRLIKKRSKSLADAFADKNKYLADIGVYYRVNLPHLHDSAYIDFEAAERVVPYRSTFEGAEVINRDELIREIAGELNLDLDKWPASLTALKYTIPNPKI